MKYIKLILIVWILLSLLNILYIVDDIHDVIVPKNIKEAPDEQYHNVGLCVRSDTQHS